MTTIKQASDLLESLHSSMRLNSLVNELRLVNEEKKSVTSIEKLSDKVITNIWKRMLAIYGHKWSSHLGLVDDGDGNLSESAKTWQAGLSGITKDNLRHGFNALVLRNHEWPPSLPEFRKLCLSKENDAIPGIDEVISTLITVFNKKGSIVVRYKHPLVFAISQEIDMHILRVSKYADAKRMVKPVYDLMRESGWQDFLPHAYEDQLSISHKALPSDKATARKFLSSIKEIL